ncbi:unnamed protein product [Rotaria sp. Silwood1]|nr:unnamed protein product [Rotaria sp. Silwood1]CAF4659920.1 unnamed protein product [Rotaria sp. Silwood1]
MNESTVAWEDLILHRKDNTAFKSRTCKIYNNKARCSTDLNKSCPCGRMVRRHSFTDESVEFKETKPENTAWKPPKEFREMIHSAKVPINIYGTLQSTGCKFLRIDLRLPIKDLFQLILEDCQKQKPALILSIYGGAKYFTMTERLEKEFIRGVIDAATMANAWILTAGINNGISKLVGEGISHYRVLREYSIKVKCIGMTMWSTINDNARLELKNASKGNPRPLCERQIPENTQEDKETIEPNHTHCILFDSGKLNEYLSDIQRNQFVTEACNYKDQGKENDYTCYAVTIIVEGGTGSLEVLENDIKGRRPIVLIQGSGRLADVLAMLVEQTSNPDRNQHWDPSDQEIEQALDRFYPTISISEVSLTKKRIQNILKQENRYLLHVFSMDRDKNVAEIIFKAIFTATKKKTKIEDNQKHEDEPSDQEKQRRKDEDKLVDLALEWSYFDGVLPILQARQGDMVKKNKYFIEEDIKRQKYLFLKSLQKNRSKFIEYFLIAGFDPLTLVDNNNSSSYQKFIEKLYVESYTVMNMSHKNRLINILGILPLRRIKDIDYKLNQFIGSFFESIYSFKDTSFGKRIKIDLSNHVCTCCGFHKHVDDKNELNAMNNHIINDQTIDTYTKHHLLRDLFLWSILMDMPEMAKVLLLHVRSRICAALIASAVFKRYSKASQTVDVKDKFRMQSLEFETYAAMCVNKCYEYNEKRACELLVRQIPLFGNITCMQAGISSESVKLLETACFDQTLNQVWFDKLALSNQQTSAKLLQIPSIITFGLIAPWIITYRKENEESLNSTKNDALSEEGINYYVDEKNSKEGTCSNYWKCVQYFHESSMIKMSYHFISYIWFLLVFSYMMLYHLDSRNTFIIPHWTEIYVIITVSTMFCEEARRLYYEYHTRMLERWGSTGSNLLTVLTNIFYILPYFLFYLGLGFRYASYTEELLSTARIIWALDLELWYLRSLKFVMALKFLGPKLFMLKNMLRDLFAFVFMIFIAITAYGVVSRALILYKQVPFTGHGIFSEIFYEPYWFIYGEVSDKYLLDNIIHGDSNSTTGNVAEASATHVLLAFHMLFINILLLNLLIAVFADSIGKVQENTEFYWRYQRYSFVREYFERLPLSYPPLIVISHIILIILTIQQKCCPSGRNQVANQNQVPWSKKFTRIFKMIPKSDTQDEQWDSFENAATYSYVRSILENDKNKNALTTNHEQSNKIMTTTDSNTATTTVDQQQIIENLKNDLMSTFKAALTETQKGLEQNNSRMEYRLDQMKTSLEWVMNAMTRVKMNNPKEPRPTFEFVSTKNDVSLPNQTTTLTTNSAE